jgi:hypothetical protein
MGSISTIQATLLDEILSTYGLTKFSDRYAFLRKLSADAAEKAGEIKDLVMLEIEHSGENNIATEYGQVVRKNNPAKWQYSNPDIQRTEETINGLKKKLADLQKRDKANGTAIKVETGTTIQFKGL